MNAGSFAAADEYGGRQQCGGDDFVDASRIRDGTGVQPERGAATDKTQGHTVTSLSECPPQ